MGFVVRFYKFFKMLHLDLLVVAKFLMKVDPDRLHRDVAQRRMTTELATTHERLVSQFLRKCNKLDNFLPEF